MLEKRTNILETLKNISKEVTLFGWVDSIRDHGKVAFIDLRDATGKIQVVFYGQNYIKIKDLSIEDVVEVTGSVKERSSNQVNANNETGTVEIDLINIHILNKTKELPLPIDTSGIDISEDTRLRYRYVDMRRPRMQKNLRLRSEYFKHIRNALLNRSFVEVETPILTKSTKEGARDFIVPSRHAPGKFYALPQSPQQYKQLLMTGGIEKYFQFAKCIRDEDLRADRGYEFTQLDLEMSFVERDDVMRTVEEVVKEAIKQVGGKLQNEKFPVIDYKDALAKYGADKFDMRTEEEKKENILAFAWVVNFPFFKKVDKADAAEVEDGKSGWTFTHNPFSMPIPEHLEWHLTGENVDKIVTTQYDLVCNGYEVGGGSIRAHKPEILKATFKIMGYSDNQIEENVGHMIEAFSLGTPPHGGIALGLDRHIMILSNETSLKEVIAFPMTSKGKTAVMDAPSSVSDKQLKELGISIASTKK